MILFGVEYFFVVRTITARISPNDVFLCQYMACWCWWMIYSLPGSVSVLASIVATLAANVFVYASKCVAWSNSISSPYPHTAIKTSARGYSERTVCIGSIDWNVALGLALAKAIITWSMPIRSWGLVGSVGWDLSAQITKRAFADTASNVDIKSTADGYRILRWLRYIQSGMNGWVKNCM